MDISLETEKQIGQQDKKLYLTLNKLLKKSSNGHNEAPFFSRPLDIILDIEHLHIEGYQI